MYVYASMCGCVYVCVCMCIYVCVFEWGCLYVSMCAYVRVHLYARNGVCSSERARAHARVCVCVYVWVYICMFTYVVLKQSLKASHRHFTRQLLSEIIKTTHLNVSQSMSIARYGPEDANETLDSPTTNSTHQSQLQYLHLPWSLSHLINIHWCCRKDYSSGRDHGRGPSSLITPKPRFSQPLFLFHLTSGNYQLKVF